MKSYMLCVSIGRGWPVKDTDHNNAVVSKSAIKQINKL